MTRKLRVIAAATAVATLGAGLVSGTAIAAGSADAVATQAVQSSQIEVGPSWKDTDGNLLEAHGGAANKVNEAEFGIDVTGDGDTDDDVYLLYGEKKTNATRPVDGINGYWSTDLENWHYMGNVLRTHNVLPNKVISISGDESYTDYDSQQYFADHKVSQDGKTTNYAAGSQKYTVLDEANLQTLKDLANSGEDTEDAKSAKAFIEPYVTERDSNGKAIAYDEASLKIGFEYLYGMYNIVERPKVVYNKATKQFVAIFHSDGAVNANADRIKWIEGLTKSGLGVTGGKTYFEQGIANNDATAKNTGSRYSRAQIGFAVSDSPFGPFKMVNSTRMNFDKSLHATRFGESRDMTVFVDYGHDVNNDGADDAYAVYSSEMNAKMYISLLNKEYTAPIAAGDSEPEGDHTWRSRVLPDNSREASALFYHDGWYYMITSGTDGWNSTPVIYYRAKSVLQDAVWEKLGNPFTGDNPSKGYDSQPTYVLVEDQDKGQFIYMGDRWVVDGRTGSAGQNSKLIWLPIEITGNADKPINISGRASWNPFDESLYSAPKDYGSIVLEQGSLLPETLKIDGRDVAVSWADGANDQVVSAAAGATLSLNFTVDGARYNVSVQIIAPGLTYYVDSGAKDEASASDYAAVKAAVPGLKNATPDQVSDGTGWGYVSSNVVAKSDAGNGKADTGLYTNNSGTIISYKLPLDAGSYTLDAGFHDWWAQWTDNRAMDLTVAAADGAELGKGSAATSKSAADATGTVSFTLDKAQTVTFSVTRAANATADPILNWFTVSKKATVLDSTIVATAGKLPATVSIDGKDTAVTWSAASVSAASAKASVVASINATGSADGTPVSATVLNVPANTVYFADSGAAASAATPDYDAVKAALGDALLNQSADQQWDGKASGKTWGYSGGTGTGVVDAKSNGWNNSFVSADYDSKNGQITYHLTLKAGKYNIGAVQSHVKYPNGIYSTVKVGDETIGARKTLTGLSDANDTVVQSVEVAKDSVVDVTVGTDGNSGYNLRLAAVWAAKTGDVTVPETPVVDVDQANFPDAAFLKLVKDYDTNGNGNLSDKEIAAVTDITAPVAGIKDLKGIEHFTALKQLIVDRNEITAVDLSTLVNLEKLDLSSNKLTALDVSKLTGLKRLDIADNQIAPALDLSANGKLTYINVGVNALAAIRLPETTQHALTSINAKDQIAVEVQATDGVFDLKTIADWFDPAKVNDLKGAELDGTTLKNITGDTVTYDYVIPDGKIKYTLPVTLKVTAAQPSVDKSDLQAAVDEAGKLVESDYTAESWEAFASALRNANTVLVDDQATQESVDDAVRRLAEARGALKPADKPSVDKSDLQAAVDAAGELTESDYTAESWEAFASALRNANTVLADDKAAQADVDGALWRLVAARDALVKAEQPAPVDKTGLQAAVDEAGKLVESDYTAESWEPFARALDMARTVLADPNATADDVAAALEQLTTARDALVEAEQPGPGTPASPTDRARLAARIQEIRDLNLVEAEYTADSWKALQDALAAGEDLLGADGLTLERVDRAIESIDAAYKGLVKAEEPSANTPPTLSGVGDATVMVGDAFDYYAGVTATDREDGLLPSSQIEVEGRVDTSKPGRYELAYTATDYQGLKSERVTRWVTVVERTAQADKSRLQALVDEYSKLTATDYTGVSWKPFEAALEAAKTVLAKADATQSEVDGAHDALRAAWIGLVRVGDRSALEAAVAEARRIQPGGYTTDSWTRFAKALDNAEAVLAKGDATQSELDAAQARLTAAIAGLKVRPSEPSGPSYPSGPSVSYVTVTFDSQGGSAVADRVVVSGTTVEAPAAPVRDGYAFYRWTSDAEGEQPYDFGTPVSSSLTLYAQWKVPVYRLYNPYMAQGASHLYTVNRQEYDYLKTQGWNQEGVAFLTDAKSDKVRPVYRLYNRYDGSHHFTLDPEEYEYLKTQGWTQEGEAWYASDTQGSDVYRLYNRYTGEHLWTTSQQEYDYLESQGWTKEGVAFRAYLA